MFVCRPLRKRGVTRVFAVFASFLLSGVFHEWWSWQMYGFGENAWAMLIFFCLQVRLVSDTELQFVCFRCADRCGRVRKPDSARARPWPQHRSLAAVPIIAALHRVELAVLLSRFRRRSHLVHARASWPVNSSRATRTVARANLNSEQ